MLMKTAAVALGFATVVGMWPATIAAQDYPSRNVSFVVPTGAGAANDLIARVLAPKLSERLGKTFVVENRPGSGTVVGARSVLAAQPDGHTLLMATSTVLAINATLHKNLPYDPAKDFVPVALISAVPFTLMVRNELPVSTVKEFIKYAKERPGQLSYASTGPGSPFHLYAELFSSMTGIKMVHVPYRAAVAGLSDLMGGHVQVMFGDFSSSLPLIRAGKVRTLGVTTKTRVPFAQDIAPIAELGVPGFDASAWMMVAVRAETPKPAVDKLHEALKAVMAMIETQQEISKIGMIPLQTGSVPELQAFVKSEIDRWGEVVKKAGAVIE
jgi:tripartite-type tricarboxylate transporter receptor subunit TctC